MILIKEFLFPNSQTWFYTHHSLFVVKKAPRQEYDPGSSPSSMKYFFTKLRGNKWSCQDKSFSRASQPLLLAIDHSFLRNYALQHQDGSQGRGKRRNCFWHWGLADWKRNRSNFFLYDFITFQWRRWWRRHNPHTHPKTPKCQPGIWGP